MATSVLWLCCLFVGGLGFALSYARPVSPNAPPLQLQLLKVELTSHPAPALSVPQPSPFEPAQPPPPVAATPMPPALKQVALGKSGPLVAFAIPSEFPARIADVKQAGNYPRFSQSASVVTGSGSETQFTQPGTGAAPAPPVQTLTYGEGEGRQPAPHYPDVARRAGQEGTVVIRLSVDAAGHVLAAEPSAPSPWSALNLEALRVVREQWRFKTGPVRFYEVAIRFQLTK